MKSAVLIAFSLLVTQSLFAQKYDLTGRILDETSKKSVEYATIKVLNSDSSLITGAITDSAGHFFINGLHERNILIKIQCIGYKALFIQKISTNYIKLLDLQTIFLTIDAALLNEVVIHGEKANTVLKMDKQVINAQQFQNAKGGSGLDVLKNIASVTVNNVGNISLRGNEGFLVLINGKPTNRIPADVLSQLPANAIENIEIITSPSAKYDVDGKAGIINIITIKETAQGLSVITNSMFGGIDPLRTGGDISFNYGKRKFNIYTIGNYRRYDFNGYRYGNTRTIVGDTTTFLYSEGIRDYIEFDYSASVGINYKINLSNTFNIGFYAGFKESDREANLNYTEYYKVSPAPILFDNVLGNRKGFFFNENLFVRTGEFYTANADYSHVFKNKGNITFLSMYEYSILGGPLTQKETNRIANTIILNERSAETNPLNSLRLQTDYSIPFANDKTLECGLQIRLLHHIGNFNFERQNLNSGIWNNVPDFTDTLNLQQNIYAGYTQLSGKKNILNYNLGLRLEYTERTLKHTLETNRYYYEKFDLFPTAQILWNFDKDQKVKLSYNRRIDRPTTRLMAPFKNHRHTESIEVGDPKLLPEIADIAELSYIKNFKAFTLTSNAYFNYVTNKIFRLNDVYNRHTLIRTYTNAGNATSIGLELTADIKLTSWWKCYIAGNVYDFHVKGIVNDQAVNNESFNYTIKGSTTMTVEKQISLQWDVNYISKTVTAIGTDGNLFLSNVSAKYTFWKKNAYVGLKMQNIFNSNDQVFITEGNNFYSSIEFIKYDRGLQFIFGVNLNDTVKKAKTVKTDYGEKDF